MLSQFLALNSTMNNNNNNLLTSSDEIFNLQAFIAHVESLVAHENAATRRQYLPNHFNSRELPSNRMHPNFHRPMLMHETRNFANSRVFQAPPQQPLVMLRASTGLFPNAGRAIAASQLVDAHQAPTQPIHQEMEMEVSPVDGTKPYINLLDKPINNNVNEVNMNVGNLLDLALRL